MLQIFVEGREFYNDRTNEFYMVKPTILNLEHSLISISKWEAKWCVPFISKEGKTLEQTVDYIKCMTLNPNVDPMVYECLSSSDIERVNEYVSAPMTATWFKEDKNKPQSNRKATTNELIYYWMIQLQIPFECQKWHLNRLLTLIRVCNEENNPPKKMSRKDLLSRNAALNAARRKKFNSKG